MLPVMDLHATDPTALYSLLLFVDEQCKKLNIRMPCVTFDQQLYVIAYNIVSSKNMDIFFRLGGFHQLMSFLGSIGSLMAGSGLRSALETVYVPVTVGHMFTGKAYSRAVRGHLLCASAILSLVLEEFWSGLSCEEQKTLEELYDSDCPSAHSTDIIAQKLMNFFVERKEQLTRESRTSTLWLSYVHYVSVVQEFIRAERTSDWLLHISATKNMLNLFAATGHNNYAKSCRLYLQTITALETTYPDVYEQFMFGNHTVRRSNKQWAGIWTDLSIEQILVKSLKGKGGVIGKCITENVLKVWTKTMHRCAEVTDALTIVSLLSNSDDKHKETFASRVKRDNDDFEKVQTWFRSHNPFEVAAELMALDSGLVDDKNCVTCDRAEEIGADIQAGLDGKTFASCSFKRKNQITTIQSLYSNIKIDSEGVSIDPLTLFLRLVVVVERQPENEIADYFHYELSPYPMSLFKDGVMRTAQKSKLKSHILDKVKATQEPVSIKIADGGALLWCCDWKKNEQFCEIFEKYTSLLKHLQAKIVVFDGYDMSTKDATHQKRSGKVSQTVEIHDQHPCPAERKVFLSNYTNKKHFVMALSKKLELDGFKVVLCPSDADTTIVKVALDFADGTPVTVYSDDTDVLCLLVHHAKVATILLHKLFPDS